MVGPDTQCHDLRKSQVMANTSKNQANIKWGEAILESLKNILTWIGGIA